MSPRATCADTHLWLNGGHQAPHTPATPATLLHSSEVSLLSCYRRGKPVSVGPLLCPQSSSRCLGPTFLGLYVTQHPSPTVPVQPDQTSPGMPCVPQRPARPLPRVCLPFALGSPGGCLAQRSDLVPSAGLGIQSAPWIQGHTSGALRTSVLSLLRSPPSLAPFLHPHFLQSIFGSI